MSLLTIFTFCPLPRFFACVLSVSWLPVSTSAKPLEAPAKTPGVIPSPLTGVCSGVPIHSAGFPARGLFPVFPACWFRELRLSPNCSRRVLQLGPNLARYTAMVLLRAPSSVNPPRRLRFECNTAQHRQTAGVAALFRGTSIFTCGLCSSRSHSDHVHNILSERTRAVPQTDLGLGRV